MSSLGNSEPMYVLDPYETATIQGWRTSLDNVRRFVFVDEQRSYAQRTGQANSDMGWIRVLAFHERRLAWRNPRYQVPQPWNGERDDELGRLEAEEGQRAESPESGSKDQAGGDEMSKAAPSEPNALYDQRSNGNEQRAFPGTGWGDQRRDPVQRVEFYAAAQATDHLVLRYEYASGLRALGIVPQTRPWRLWEREGQLGFAQPPRW
jgi:hypothetical protein